MYHQMWHSAIPHSAHTVYLYAHYRYQNSGCVLVRYKCTGFYNRWVSLQLGAIWVYIIQCCTNEAETTVPSPYPPSEMPIVRTVFFRRPAQPASIFYSVMHFTARLVSAVSCPGTTLKTSASRQTKFGALRQCVLAGWDLPRRRRFGSHRYFEES